AGAHTAFRVNQDAMRVAGQFVPVAPAVDRMSAPLQFVDRLRRKPSLDVERIARLTERETTGEEARRLQCFLNIAAVVDERDVSLQMQLRLTVGAHAAERSPEFAFAEGERGNQRVQRDLPGLEFVWARRIKREISGSILQYDAGPPRDDRRAKARP